MNSAIQVFNYNTHEVRTVNKDGEIWFVVKDVCDILELSNPTVAIDSLDDDERAKFFLGRQGEANIISESGLYSLIFRSNKSEAKQFSRWVRHEVLPQINKTGSYSANKNNPALMSGLIDGARIIFELADIKGNQLVLALDKVYRSFTGQSALLAAGIELQAPVKEQTLTPSEIADALGLPKGHKGARIVNKLLENAGYQHKIGKNWEPLELGKNYSVMLDMNKRHSDGTPVRQVKWNSSIINIIENLLK